MKIAENRVRTIQSLDRRRSHMHNDIHKYAEELMDQGVQVIYRVLFTSTVLSILATIHFFITSTYPLQKRINVTYLPLAFMLVILVLLLYIQLNVKSPKSRGRFFVAISYACYLGAVLFYFGKDIIPMVILLSVILSFMTLVLMNTIVITFFHLTAIVSATLLYFLRHDNYLHIGIGFAATLILLSCMALYTSYKYILLFRNYTSKIQLQFMELMEKDQKSALLHKASRELVWYFDLETGKREFPELDTVDIPIALSPSSQFSDWVTDLHPDDRPNILNLLQEVAEGNRDYFESEFRRLDENHKPIWYSIKTISVRDSSGKVVKMAGTYIWIHDKKTKELEIEYLAYHDEVTGILNRSAFLRDADAFMLRVGSDEGCFLIYLDIQNFRDINSTFGHQSGDVIICGIAERLKELGPELVIYKLTSTDFGIWGHGDDGTAIHAAHRILDFLKKPFILSGKDIFVQVRMGISAYPTDASDGYSLFRNADTALHHCRKEESLKYLVYTPEMTTLAYSRMNMMNHLHQAILNDELSLVYQPLINVNEHDFSIYGFECLLRWSNPQLGNVPPSEFIPLAEESGLIHGLGEWVIKESCHFIEDVIGLNPNIVVSINISAKQLAMDDFVVKLNRIVKASGVPTRNLCLEITESSFIESFEDVGPKIAYLRELGYLLALDDFGTGYSSLNYLGQLQIDTLKIDRSFSAKILSSASDYYLIKSIINLTTDLGLKFVAEGIETKDQLDALVRIGCPIVQGYHFSKPLQRDPAIHFLKDGIDSHRH